MLKIRLSRLGAKKKPFYPVVVIDSRKARDAQCIEKLGFFNPMVSPQGGRLRLDIERINFWKSRGAQFSERVLKLIKEFNLGQEAFQKKRDKDLAKWKEKRKIKKEAEKKSTASAPSPAAQTA